MKKTPQNLLLSLLLTISSLELGTPNTNQAVTINDFDEGENGEV